MQNEVKLPAVLGILAAVLIIVAVIGFGLFSGNKAGKKPTLNPVLNRMYGPHPAGPETAAPQGQADKAGQGP